MSKLVTWICWGLVMVLWIVEAARGARRAPGHRQGTRRLEVLWQFGAAVLVVIVVRFLLPDLRRLTDRSRWIELPGLVLLVVSTVFTIWARLSLGRMWSIAPNMLQQDHKLRTTGPYSITRHPIYTGLSGMLLGTVLLNGVGTLLVILAVGVAALAVRIPTEERLMSAAFPEEYARYRERVPRLFPHPRRRSTPR
jgi:protein-S-isoprenylcysteine O-methyltransferase Ste14